MSLHFIEKSDEMTFFDWLILTVVHVATPTGLHGSDYRTGHNNSANNELCDEKSCILCMYSVQC